MFSVPANARLPPTSNNVLDAARPSATLTRLALSRVRLPPIFNVLPCVPCSTPPFSVTFWPTVPVPDRTTLLPMAALPLKAPVTCRRPLDTSALPPSLLATTSVPLATRVVPVKALLSAFRRNAPAPVFSNVPLPEILPA
ncbi:hypothetical protein D3C71_1101320 [compost metagenome]